MARYRKKPENWPVLTPGERLAWIFGSYRKAAAALGYPSHTPIYVMSSLPSRRIRSAITAARAAGVAIKADDMVANDASQAAK